MPKVIRKASSSVHYQKAADLPEDRRKAYENILEDLDKQGL
jgi:hypothetical protein